MAFPTLNQFKSALSGLTISTKALLSAIVTGTSVLQIQEARDFAIKHASAHPRIVSIASGICGILVVLHNPKVQKFLHIEPGTPVTLPAGTEAIVTGDPSAKIE